MALEIWLGNQVRIVVKSPVPSQDYEPPAAKATKSKTPVVCYHSRGSAFGLLFGDSAVRYRTHS